jgi:hypothetical protein
MPSYAPREEPVKKKQELDLKKQVLENAILHNLDLKVIRKKAEQFKTTKILYSKAILHVIREREWQKREHSFNKEKALEEIEIWNKKSVDEIIEEIKSKLKI